MTTLRYYFDFISPYAYLGWSQVQALAQRSKVELHPVPVLFAALLDAHGHKGPAEIEPKRIYTWKHVLRVAHDLGLSMQPPPAHPFNPLLALRVASLPRLGEQRVQVIDLLFRRTWVDGVGVTEPDALVEALDAIGLPGATLLEEAASDEAKQRVRTQTEEALARGVFGVPSTEVDGTGEVFWGQDALPHVERYLGGHDPVPTDLLARWSALPKGSVRPGSRR